MIFYVYDGVMYRDSLVCAEAPPPPGDLFPILYLSFCYRTDPRVSGWLRYHEAEVFLVISLARGDTLVSHFEGVCEDEHSSSDSTGFASGSGGVAVNLEADSRLSPRNFPPYGVR